MTILFPTPGHTKNSRFENKLHCKVSNLMLISLNEPKMSKEPTTANPNFLQFTEFYWSVKARNKPMTNTLGRTSRREEEAGTL